MDGPELDAALDSRPLVPRKLAYLCLRQVRKRDEKAKTAVSNRKKTSPKPSDRSISRLDRLLGPSWDGVVIQLDSRDARRETPRA